VISISPATHYELYHDWVQALEFCRAIPDVPPPGPVAFHMYWKQRRSGLLRRRRPFGRKQALPVKSFFATQDLSRARLVLWSDEDLSGSEWLQPFADRIDFRIYVPALEARGTILEDRADLYREEDHRVWRDGDLFRILALHNYGGVYVDMDMVLLRSLGALLEQEFIYQWEDYDGDYNGAVMHTRKGSVLARELVAGVVELPPDKFNWGRENLKRAVALGVDVTIFPGAFFDTEWQAHGKFRPFHRHRNSTAMYDGAFAWHWHNRWDDHIQAGSKFQLMETRIDARLQALGFALPVMVG
jgi:Glycosyltransferase sugar-binding region containing DXD motif